MKHYILDITTRDGSKETTETYLTSFQAKATEKEIELYLNSMLLDWYSGGVFHEDGSKEYVMFPDGFACYYTQFQEVPTAEFNILKKHHSDLTQKFNVIISEKEDSIELLKKSGFVGNPDLIFSKEIHIKNVNGFFLELDKISITDDELEVDYDDENDEFGVTAVNCHLDLMLNDMDKIKEILSVMETCSK